MHLHKFELTDFKIMGFNHVENSEIIQKNYALYEEEFAKIF